MSIENNGPSWDVRLAHVVPLVVATATHRLCRRRRWQQGRPLARRSATPRPQPTTIRAAIRRRSIRTRSISLSTRLLDVTVASADPGDVVVMPGATEPGAELHRHQYRQWFRSLSPDAESRRWAAISSIPRPPRSSSIPTATASMIPASILSILPGATIRCSRPMRRSGSSSFRPSPAGAVDRRSRLCRPDGGSLLPVHRRPGNELCRPRPGRRRRRRRRNRRGRRRSRPLIVQNATSPLSRAQSVADPFGGSETVPGAIMTYTLVATVTGSGTLTIWRSAIRSRPTQPIRPARIDPADGCAMTDATDADAGERLRRSTAMRHSRHGSARSPGARPAPSPSG